MGTPGHDSVQLALLLTQFLVLIFTAVVWLVARRDLTARAAEARAPVVAELEQVRATVENLTQHLDQRADAALHRLEAGEKSFAPRLQAALSATLATEEALQAVQAAEARLTQIATTAEQRLARTSAQTLEAAETRLKQRATATEGRVAATLQAAQADLEAAFQEAQERLEAARVAERRSEARFRREEPISFAPDSPRNGAAPEPAGTAPLLEPEPPLGEEAHFAPVYALVAAGITDTVEIARRTGLGRGEIELLLSLRSLRAHSHAQAESAYPAD